MRAKRIVSSWLVVSVILPASAAADENPCGMICTNGDKSLLLAKQMLELPSGATGLVDGQSYSYGTRPYCRGTVPDSPDGADCTLTDIFCKRQPNGVYVGTGPAEWVFRRMVNPDTDWERQGLTCYPNLVPDKVNMAMITDAFHKTPLAAPQLTMQPPGGKTLVTLPNFFQVSWPDRGVLPGELDTLSAADWFGMNITLKPELNSITYSFGDGSTVGPTLNLGGPYPSGDITKTFDEAGEFQVSADAVYTGWVSIDGSEWIEIPGTVAIAGTPERVSVKTARNSLHLS